MTPFDPYPTHFDPNAFPPALRAISFALSLAIVGIVLFQTATAAAAAIV
jgi:hypothetical protein